MIPRCPLCAHQHWPGMPHLRHDQELEQLVVEPKPAKQDRKGMTDASRQAAGERMRRYWAQKRAVDQSRAKALADAPQGGG